MDLGRTLAGAVIGAAIGLGLHLAFGAVAKTEAVWFAIIVGALTGLGVRQAHRSLAGNVNYARGAVAAIIALVAIFASLYFVRVVIAKVTSKVNLTERPPVEEPVPAPAGTETAEEPAGEGTVAGTEGEEPAGEATVGEVADRPRATRPKLSVSVDNKLEAPAFNVWDFLCIGLGVFLAYEFARGTGAKAPAAPSPEAV